MSGFHFEPIGVVHSPLCERASAPRQPSVGTGIAAKIELYPGFGYEDALSGLDEWDYMWVIFVFHRNVDEGRGWKPKVLPPRATGKTGVLATRAPHRPNPIGLSAVRIDRVEGRFVHVRDVDLLDGTPVLDLKPYVAYADARPGAHSGWLEPRDPKPPWEVAFAEDALARLRWLAERGIDLRGPIESALALGPQPHAYRRIRKSGDAFRLALKEWRVAFAVEGRRIVVRDVGSGYGAHELASDPRLAVHREFAVKFD